MVSSLQMSLLIATIDGQKKIILKIYVWPYILQFFPAVPNIYTFQGIISKLEIQVLWQN